MMRKRIAIIVIAIAVAGCGPRLVYPNLDWLIPFYVDDYISLNREQGSLLENRLLQALDWHCRTQLPAYATTLKDLAEAVGDPSRPVGMSRFDFFSGRFEAHWRDLKKQISPDIADILVTASDKQIAELVLNLKKHNAAYKAEYVDIPEAARSALRQKEMISSLEKWVSRLTPAQRQAVGEWNHRIRPLATDEWESRQNVLSVMEPLLAERRSAEDFKARFVGRLVELDKLRTHGFQEKIEANYSETLRLLVRIERSLTPDQRRRLIQRIHSLTADIERLSCDPRLANRGS